MRLNSILSLAFVMIFAVGCESLLDGKKDRMDMDASYNEAEIRDDSALQGTGSYEEFKASVADRVFFGFDTAKLTADGMSALDQQADWMAQYPAVDIIVEGHADIRGTREYNLALGEQRARSIRDYLVSRGVNPNRIHTVSYGKERVEYDGDAEDTHSKNRRGVSVIQ